MHGILKTYSFLKRKIGAPIRKRPFYLMIRTGKWFMKKRPDGRKAGMEPFGRRGRLPWDRPLFIASGKKSRVSPGGRKGEERGGEEGKIKDGFPGEKERPAGGEKRSFPAGLSVAFFRASGSSVGSGEPPGGSGVSAPARRGVGAPLRDGRPLIVLAKHISVLIKKEIPP
ncbi:hypothetical protein B4135_0043 [Caldibacillus debilis]|uniref:Uncharacterized protein n=1 Tax=Caldibacillus debilis TaxID=301148 RepID=A0A150M311_9BACI|nr:hypothetical protein B4135_0043 [Caldibacillus debilis]